MDTDTCIAVWYIHQEKRNPIISREVELEITMLNEISQNSKYHKFPLKNNKYKVTRKWKAITDEEEVWGRRNKGQIGSER